MSLNAQNTRITKKTNYTEMLPRYFKKQICNKLFISTFNKRTVHFKYQHAAVTFYCFTGISVNAEAT